MNKDLNNPLYWPRIPFLWIIKAYQKTISPDHGLFKHWFEPGYCRFYPTCSEYTYQKIKKEGLIFGLPKSLWRILRCNPWGRGGIDLP